MAIPGWSARLEAYTLSKTAVFWACAACIAVTIFIGFNYGGWVTGGTAADMARRAADGARAELAASVCVKQFGSAPNAAATLTSLAKTDSWKRGDFIEKGGWVTLPGVDKTVSGAADLCAKYLTDAIPPAPANTAG